MFEIQRLNLLKTIKS